MLRMWPLHPPPRWRPQTPAAVSSSPGPSTADLTPNKTEPRHAKLLDIRVCTYPRNLSTGELEVPEFIELAAKGKQLHTANGRERGMRYLALSPVVADCCPLSREPRGSCSRASLDFLNSATRQSSFAGARWDKRTHISSRDQLPKIPSKPGKNQPYFSKWTS